MSKLTNNAEAERAFRIALDVAREQHAKSLELRATKPSWGQSANPVEIGPGRDEDAIARGWHVSVI